jgi:UDP-N-acetylmuramate--alanine ligase
MSDYGHHPTEILLTTQALKEKNPEKKLFVVFQPHQYNRTLELLEDFKTCFKYCDTLVIPDIYASRDTKEDIEKINGEKFVQLIDHPQVIF